MQVSMIKYAAIVIVCLGAGFWPTYLTMNAQKKALALELKVEKEAHAKSRIAIAAQAEAIKKQVKTCSTRIVAKDNLIKEFQRVLKLKGVNHETGNDGSDILGELNGMYQADSPDGVRPASSASSAAKE